MKTCKPLCQLIIILPPLEIDGLELSTFVGEFCVSTNGVGVWHLTFSYFDSYLANEEWEWEWESQVAFRWHLQHHAIMIQSIDGSMETSSNSSLWRRNRGHCVSDEILDREGHMQQSNGIRYAQREYIPTMNLLPRTAQVHESNMCVNETRPNVIDEINLIVNFHCFLYCFFFLLVALTDKVLQFQRVHVCMPTLCGTRQVFVLQISRYHFSKLIFHEYKPSG